MRRLRRYTPSSEERSVALGYLVILMRVTRPRVSVGRSEDLTETVREVVEWQEAERLLSVLLSRQIMETEKTARMGRFRV